MTNYRGDAYLEGLLKKTAFKQGVSDIYELIQGVLAAPVDIHENMWLSLVADQKNVNLIQTIGFSGESAGLSSRDAKMNSGLVQKSDAHKSPWSSVIKDPNVADLVQQLLALKNQLQKDYPTNLSLAATKQGCRQRLQQLRGYLLQQKLDGFLIPRTDEYQGEYVALYAERLAWLTGFTGSYGLAVVLQEKAALFVDGRYILQAGQQTDAECFIPFLDREQPSDGWLVKNLQKGQRLGYDPWLHTPNQLQRFMQAAEKVGAVLVRLDKNPIDQIWVDHPKLPISPVAIQPVQYAGRNVQEKSALLAQELQQKQADAVVLTAPESIAWLLNIRGGDVPNTPFAHSVAIFHQNQQIDWLIDLRKLPANIKQQLPPTIQLHPISLLGTKIDQLGQQQKTIMLDPDITAEWFFNRLEKSGAVIKRASDPCQLPRACKNATEVKGTRASHQRDGAAICNLLAWLEEEVKNKRPLTELSVADQLYQFRQQNALFRGISFETIAGAGPHGAIVHYRATSASNRLLKEGELFLLDSGGQYLDGTTDITRTISIGNPTADMKKHFTLVLKGHIALGAAKFPKGVSGHQLDAIARYPLWQYGLNYDHGTGHGVGSYLSVHEGPQRISAAPNQVALQPGMILSNEPGYYKAGAYGIRIENLVLVVPATIAGAEREMLGFENLTLAPFDRRLIDISLLTSEEIAWVDAYHQRVYQELQPLILANTQKYLAWATAPLKT